MACNTLKHNFLTMEVLVVAAATVLVSTALALVCRYPKQNDKLEDEFFSCSSWYWWSSAPSASTMWAVIPGKIPWLGNAWQIGGLSRLYEQLYRWADNYCCDHGVYEFSLFGTKYLVVCHHDRIVDLVQKHRPYDLVRSNKVKSVANSLGAKGLFTAEGHQWSFDRRLVAPALNRKNIRCSYHKFMKMASQRLVHKWASAGITKTSPFGMCGSGSSCNTTVTRAVLIHNDLHSLSIDILSLAVYGKDANTIEAMSDQTSRDVMAILDLAMVRMFAPFAYWEIPIIGQYLDGGGWIKKRLIHALDQLVFQQQTELENCKNVPEAPPVGEAGEDDHTNGRSHNTFLRKILALNQVSEETMPRERLIGQLLTLFLGGSDSLGTLLTTAFWQLATDTNLQESMAREICNVRGVGNNDVQDATMEDMMINLPLLRAFLMELIRCYGPQPTIFLAAAKDLDFECLGGHFVIPQGSEVILLTQYASTNPNAPPSETPLGPLGEEPNQFCPERWLEMSTKEEWKVRVQLPPIHSGVHIAFGHGARMCPGKEFAELEAMTCIAYVLQRFKITLAPLSTCGEQANRPTPLHKIRVVLEDR